MSEVMSGRAKLGEILLRRCKIKRFQLEFLLRLQSAYRGVDRRPSLGELLIQHRATSAIAVQEALAAQEQMPQDSVTEVVANFENTLRHISELLKAQPERSRA